MVHRPVRDERVRSPDELEELIAAEDVAAAADERAQQLELQRCRLDRRPAAAQLGATEVHLDVPEAIDLRQLSGRATESRLDAGAQLAWTEGFRDVVIGAKLQAQHLLRLLRPGGQHDDRRALAGAAQIAA